MVEWTLEDRVEVAAAGGGYFCVRIIMPAASIFTSAVEVGLVINVLAKPILCAVFETGKNAIVSPPIEIDALIPRDFGSAA